MASFLGSLGTCQTHPAPVFGTDWPQGPALSLSGLKPAHRDETGPYRLGLDLSQACEFLQGSKVLFPLKLLTKTMVIDRG